MGIVVGEMPRRVRFARWRRRMARRVWAVVYPVGFIAVRLIELVGIPVGLGYALWYTGASGWLAILVSALWIRAELELNRR